MRQGQEVDVRGILDLAKKVLGDADPDPDARALALALVEIVADRRVSADEKERLEARLRSVLDEVDFAPVVFGREGVLGEWNAFKPAVRDGERLRRARLVRVEEIAP
jgi:hypothetical protein